MKITDNTIPPKLYFSFDETFAFFYFPRLLGMLSCLSG